MSEDKNQVQQMKPYIIVAGILFVLLVVLMLWPSGDKPNDTSPETVLNAEPENAVLSEAKIDEEPMETALFEPPKMPSEVVIGDENAAVNVLEPIIEELEQVSLDVSDAAVKAAIIEAIRSPAISRFLVSESLLQKFVINANNLANQEITLKDNLLVAPDREFSIYQQADKIWIDRASFQRYTPYVDAIESVDTDALLSAYESYKPSLTEKFAEISRPGDDLDQTLIRAIDELLNTPLVPVPIEVISETVMYKFADPKLEGLSGPQKQMVRMGPDNMRRLKIVLREVKAELESRQ
ncbi:DUF3014 domain-containing protein [Glaciecola sp. SC05]|uniref:DUF3014 domain-containing protein n=1 Tax=Glaciecola sp. SC05 TaxID=1987355 RepID=UPI0035297DC3